MKDRSRYYALATPVTGCQRERMLRYWGDRYAACALIDGMGFISEGERQRALGRFEHAVQRFGDAFEGGCFCTLMRGEYCRGDGLHGYECQFRGWTNWHLPIFDHATFFQRPGQRVNAVVGQPYEFNAECHGGTLRRFCDAHGFNMAVESGWHCRANALVFTVAGN